jgi:hypothetical protein
VTAANSRYEAVVESAMFGWIVVLASYSAAAPPSDVGGAITGVVVNGSKQRAPVPGATVILRIDDGGALFVVAETTSDAQGRFRFDNLPVVSGSVYLPGANYQEIHYPGARVRLGERHPAADQRLIVYDTIADPSPLVATRHEIDIRAEAGVLVVTERIVVANRTRRSYVGLEAPTAESPTTFRLSLPSEFARVTFEKEFFGRQFHVNQGRLETGIPWTPGERELKFTYRLPFEGRYWSFRRPLDLPCDYVRVSVARDQIPDVASNLQKVSETDAAVVFEATGELLPAGYTIQVELGNLPVPWTTYARWGAFATLGVLVTGTTFLILRRRRVHTRVAAAQWRRAA